jgi:hypothetical protein
MVLDLVSRNGACISVYREPYGEAGKRPVEEGGENAIVSEP